MYINQYYQVTSFYQEDILNRETLAKCKERIRHQLSVWLPLIPYNQQNECVVVSGDRIVNTAVKSANLTPTHTQYSLSDRSSITVDKSGRTSEGQLYALPRELGLLMALAAKTAPHYNLIVSFKLLTTSLKNYIKAHRTLFYDYVTVDGNLVIQHYDYHIEQQVANAQNLLKLPSDFPTKYGTGAHLRHDGEGKIFYYPTLKAKQGFHATSIRPGRYLKKYFPEMTDDEIRIAANKVDQVSELKFLTNALDMIDVYLQLASIGIVNSCMSKDKWAVHPLMAYDRSDIQLAVLYQYGSPIARALVNTLTKQYPIIYGQWERMEPILQKAGYTHGSLHGAKIKRVPYPNNPSRLALPYIDAHRNHNREMNKCSHVHVYDDYLLIDDHGGIAANRYDEGYIYDDDRPTDEDEDDDTRLCDHCGDSYHEEDGCYIGDNDMHICEHCYTHNTYTVYTARGGGFLTLTPDQYIYIDAADTYYENEAACNYAGYYWSTYRAEFIHEDDMTETYDAGWVLNDDTTVIKIDDEYFTLDYVLQQMQWDPDHEKPSFLGTVPWSEVRALYNDDESTFPFDSVGLWDALPEPQQTQEAA